MRLLCVSSCLFLFSIVSTSFVQAGVEVEGWSDITKVIVSNITIIEEVENRVLQNGHRHEHEHEHEHVQENVQEQEQEDGDEDDLRQKAEYTRLQQRLNPTSSWNTNTNHPRHRLLTALHAFSRYKERNLAEVKRWRDLYKRVPKTQRRFIESTVKYTRKLNTVEHLFETNDRLARDIVRNGLEFYNVSRDELDEFMRGKDGGKVDRTSVVQAMKHFVRDWSAEGLEERQGAFDCLLENLRGVDRSSGELLKVLVPGAGVGRLGYEIDALGGFEVTLNEWSAYMNLVYRFVTQIAEPESLAYHPYIDWWSHHATTTDMQRAVSFPDMVPAASSVVMVEGDFTTLFEKDGVYDIIVTFFFIDTARNLMSYLETIHRLLRPGGAWINLGPLLYGSGPFLQLSLDEIVLVSEGLGFEFEQIETESEAVCGSPSLLNGRVRGMYVAYGQNPRGLSRNAYEAQFWRARRRPS